MSNLVEATYHLIHALKAIDCRCERDGKSTVVIYLDTDDFERAAWSMQKVSLVPLPTETFRANKRFSFTFNGITFCRRSARS